MSTTRSNNPPPPDDPYELREGTIQNIPYNREAEEAVLGAVLINPEVYYDLRGYLHSTAFYIVRHRWLWEAFEALADKRSPIDTLTVSQELETQGKLKELGGDAYLTALLNHTPTSLHAQAYAEMVWTCALRRDMLTRANTLATTAYDEKLTTEELHAAIADAGHVQDLGITNVITVDEAGVELNSEVDEAKIGAVLCHTVQGYGLPNLTAAIGGWPYRAATIVAAQSRVGKTVLMFQQAEVASLNGLKALYVSTEMGAKELIRRRVCADMGISPKVLRMGHVSEAEKDEYKQRVNGFIGLHTEHLYFDDSSRTVEDIRRSAYKIMPNLIVVDHLDELAYEGDNKVIGLGENFSKLRELVRGRDGIPDCAMVVVHQIDISLDRVPMLADLRWSRGDLTQKADLVLLGYRPDLIEVDSGGTMSMSAIQARKTRVPVEWWTRKDREGGTEVLTKTMLDLVHQRYQKPEGMDEMKYWKGARQ